MEEGREGGEADQVPLPPLHSLHSIYEDSTCILRPVYVSTDKKQMAEVASGKSCVVLSADEWTKKRKKAQPVSDLYFCDVRRIQNFPLPFAESNSGKK